MPEGAVTLAPSPVQASGEMYTDSKGMLNHDQPVEMTIEDIDFVIPHQANIRILNSLLERLSVPLEKVYVNIHKFFKIIFAF